MGWKRRKERGREELYKNVGFDMSFADCVSRDELSE